MHVFCDDNRICFESFSLGGANAKSFSHQRCDTSHSYNCKPRMRFTTRDIPLCCDIMMLTKGGVNMSTTGQKPGKGIYICIKCGSLKRLDDDSDRLAPCSKCGGTEFTP